MTRKPQESEKQIENNPQRSSSHPSRRWLKPEESPLTVYTNHAELQTTNWDFRFRFGELITSDEESLTIIEKVRVAMSPQHAKAFLGLLEDNVRKYEAAFGEIRINPSQPQEKKAGTAKTQ